MLSGIKPLPDPCWPSSKWPYVITRPQWVNCKAGPAAALAITSLTHWGRDKMAATSQTTFSSAFPWMKMFEFWLKFHRNLFIRVKLTIFHDWFRIWLGADQVKSHYLNQWWLVYWRIYASLGLNELTHWGTLKTIVLTHWPLKDLEVFTNIWFSNTL